MNLPPHLGGKPVGFSLLGGKPDRFIAQEATPVNLPSHLGGKPIGFSLLGASGSLSWAANPSGFPPSVGFSLFWTVNPTESVLEYQKQIFSVAGVPKINIFCHPSTQDQYFLYPDHQNRLKVITFFLWTTQYQCVLSWITKN